MYTHHILLILHLVAATIWVGGHLVLAIGYLPKALKHNDFSYIGNFEKTYEPIGMPSLLVLVITGILMAYDYGNIKKLPEMAVHIICVTLLGVTMVVLGSLVRIGGL